MNSGTISDDSIRTPFTGLLDSFAPRLTCAWYTVTSSVANCGMNRSAMPMIMPSSWAGRPKRANGLSRRSNASVKSMVMVVSVMRLMPSIMMVSRAPMNRHVYTPASLIRRKPRSTSTAPPCVTNRFSTATITTMAMSGASDCAALLGGTCASP